MGHPGNVGQVHLLQGDRATIMSSLEIGLIILVTIFTGAVLGMLTGEFLPPPSREQRNEDRDLCCDGDGGNCIGARARAADIERQ